MPIQVPCPTCGLKLQAPDSAAGKRVRCSGCSAVFTLPQSAQSAETFGAARDSVEPAPPIAQAPSAPENESPSAAAEAGADRRPCPMCGEMIATAAAKCRFCGEIFDPALRQLEKKKADLASPDANLSVGDWVVAVLCSGIGCIAGIIWMIQGKPKGSKMLLVSFLFALMWGAVRAITEVALKQH